MKRIFLGLLMSLSLYSYEIKSESIKNVVLDIESEYIQCLKNKKVGHMECVRIKEEQLADLFVLDQKELRYQRGQQYKKEVVNSKKIKLDNEVESCLDNAKTKEESKKCLNIVINRKKNEVKN